MPFSISLFKFSHFSVWHRLGLLALLTALTVLSTAANAQYSIVKSYGEPCVGTEMTFNFTGSCTIYEWFVSGTNYQITGGGGNANYITVKWDRAELSAYVVAKYSSCSSFPTGAGATASSTYSISLGGGTAAVNLSGPSSGCQGGRATWTATPTYGGSSPSYTWYVDGQLVQNGLSPTYSSASLLVGNHSVSVGMSSSASCLTSSTATSTTKSMTVTARPTITVTVGGQNPVCPGAQASFGATVSDYSGSLAYQWRKNGARVQSDATATNIPQYALALTGVSDNDVITCDVSSPDACGPLTTTSNSWVVSTTQVPFTVSVGTNKLSYCQNDQVVFTAQSSRPASSYQWRLNGGILSGQTGSTYTTTASSVSGLQSISVVATAGSGSCSSGGSATGSAQGIPLVVNPILIPSVSLTSTATGDKTCVNSDVTYTANPINTGSSPPTYQWKINNVVVTSNTNVLTTSFKDAAEYTVQVSVNNIQGCVSTTTTTQTKNTKVIANPIANITQSGGVSFGSGNDIVLTATPACSGCTYDWSFSPDGVKGWFSVETTASISVKRTGFYRVVVINGECTTLSATVGKVSSNEYNYIITNSIQKSGITNQTQLNALTAGSIQQTVVYFDGLGRPMQSVTTQGSPSGKDIVQPIQYDALGREAIRYLPYTDETTGFFKPNAIGKKSPLQDPTAYSATKHYQFYQSATGPADIAYDTKPFAQSVYEASPLNQVREQGAPGLAWQPGGTSPKTVKLVSRSNVANEVRLFSYAFGSNGVYGTVSSNLFYSAGQLYVSEVTDERGYKSLEFKDKNGQVLLKKVQFKGTANSTATPPDADCMLTHYVYDSFGRLRLVIQPEGSELIPATGLFTTTADVNFVNNWCFTYHYDARGRMSEKKVPGAGKVYLVYNNRDNLILTQDAKQRPALEWSVTKYDSLGRVVMTGLYVRTDLVDQAAMQDQASARAACYENPYNGLQGYTVNKSFPDLVLQAPGKDKLYTVNYYNKYDLDGNGSKDRNYEGGSTFDRTIGQLTMSKVARTDNTNWLTTAYFYDQYGRVIQTQADNHLGGRQLTNTLYEDFTPRVKSSTLVHTVSLSGATPLTVKKEFTYDKYGRLLKVLQQNNTDAKITLSEMEYNELGQVKTKKIEGTLQTMDFRYNIRGWLSAINPTALQTPTDGRLFGLALLYNKDLSGTDLPASQQQFNGNIAVQQWKSLVGKDATSNTPITRTYTYGYDAANRITGAVYSQNLTGIGENFTMNSVTYTKNGNIKSLQQSGLLSYTATATQLKANFGAIDNLSYTYSGNRLIKVEEIDTDTDPLKVSSNVSATGLAGDFQNKVNQATEYSYDDNAYGGNGNLIADANKGISVTYNSLNLPTQIWMNNGGTNRLVYLYDAAGNKLRKEVYEDGKGITSWTDYAGGFVYQKDVLQFFGTEEGRVLNPYFLPNKLGESAYVYEYHYKDHLGNLRLSFRNSRQEVIYKVSAEDVNAVSEEANFANVKKTRMGPNATKAQAGSYWIALNSVTGSLGPWKTIKVKKDDVIKAKVYANYTAATASSGVTLGTYLSNPANIQGGAESGTKLPLLQLGITFNPIPPLTGLPKAYVRYEYFNENHVYIGSDYARVGLKATTEWELLTIPSLKASQDGYVQIYLANESNLEVRFDEFEVSYAEPKVVQENHYSPFGLNLTGIETKGQPNHKYQYNGKEKQEELGLNWIDYGARMYDAQLGRWHSVDPRGEKFYPLSGYSYSANCPILLNDPSGKDWTISMTEDKNGKKNYNITFTGAVLNSSKNKKVDMVGLATGLLKQANSLYNQKGADFSISFKGSIRVINDKKELDKKETLFIVTDPTHKDFNPKDKKADDVIVGSTRNGKEIRLNEEYIDLIAIGGKGIGPYAPHEMGHTAGLEHPEEDSWFYFFDGPTADSPASNFMRTTKESKNNPTGPTKEQIERMYRLYNDGKLNRKDINPANED